jgi:decaprenyl-phosphate phosphoribosyltransferase
MLMVVAVCVPISLGNWRLGVVIAGYLTLQLLYVLWLKHEPVFDIACIALGMVLRAIAGGVAADIPISNAFLIVVGFGSLFVATGKRFSEKINESGSPDQTRPVLAHYSADYLRAILAITAAVTVIGYVLWAFEIAHGSTVPFAQLSTIPFTLCIMRYFLGVDRGEVEAPEYALFADRGLLLLGLIWGALFVGQVLTA